MTYFLLSEKEIKNILKEENIFGTELEDIYEKIIRSPLFDFLCNKNRQIEGIRYLVKFYK